MSEIPNHRQSERIPLKHDLSSILSTSNKHQAVRCLGVDVSKQGVGIASFGRLEEGMQLTLDLNNKQITLWVVWCKPTGPEETIFYAGLKACDEAVNLVEEFQQAGIIKVVSQWKFPVLTART